MYQVLIADDEAIECKALSYKLQEKFPSLHILPCVLNGIDLIKSVEQYSPDIIIVDINMPGLNGLEAIEILKMKENHAKIIIHTAYSQFTYAKKAIDLGAEAYILKPDADDEMMRTVSNIFHILKEENQQENNMQEKMEEMDSLHDIVAKKWLQSLYFGEPDEECYQMFLKNCSALEEGGFLAAWRILPAEDKILPKLWEVQQMIISYMKELCNCVEFIRKEELIFLVLPGKEEHYQIWFEELCECILNELKKKHLYAAVGASCWKVLDEEFVAGIYEASTEALTLDSCKVSFFRYGRERHRITNISSIVSYSMQELKRRNMSACMTMVKEMLQRIEEVEEKKAAAFVYLFELGEAMILTEEKRVEREWEFWRNFKELNTEKDIIIWLEEGLRICVLGIDKDIQENNVYIQKAYFYLEENFNRDISLENVAEAVGVSYFYLSRLLKQKKNTNFTEMLTKIRIWRAIRKMKNQQKPIREISEEVGYANVTYFYKVFKKNTGLAIGTIRKFL